MGTRGAFGFRLNGKDYLTYNHFDSYPDGLGENLTDQIKILLKKFSMDQIKEMVGNIKLIKEGQELSEEDKERTKEFHNTQVSEGNDTYARLRGLQGNLIGILQTGLMIDCKDFMKDSLFCEYAYVINLDDQVLEFYRGFQKEPHSNGRYGFYSSIKPNASGYYPVALKGTVALDTKIKRNFKAMAKAVQKKEG